MLGPIMPAPGGGAADRSLDLAFRRHRTGDSFHEVTDPQGQGEWPGGNQHRRTLGTTMSAKLMRSGAEQLAATNPETIGGVVVCIPRPFNRWPGDAAWERKIASRIAAVEWKRACLPGRKAYWWR